MKEQSESTIRSKSKDENLVNLFVTLTKYLFMKVLQTISILLSYTIIKYVLLSDNWHVSLMFGESETDTFLGWDGRWKQNKLDTSKFRWKEISI